MKNRFIRGFTGLSIFPKIMFSLLFVGVTPIFIVGVSEIYTNRRTGSFNLTALILCFSFFLATAIAGILARLILGPIRRLLNGIERVSSGDFDHKIETEGADEFADLARAFNGMSDSLKKNIREKEESLISLNQLKLRESQAAIAAQVAHDIRSPLFALDAALKNTAQLPEKQRIIVRHAVNRIRDVANSLLEKNRPQPGPGGAHTADQLDVHLLSSLIDPLVTEKRISFEARPGISLDFALTRQAYGLFARLQPVEFRRMLSNLVNNAVEALGDKGAVSIILAHEGKDIFLTIADNGKGIPPEILAKLGQKGETHGKAGGSGLGLFHARAAAESWGGGLRISSEPGKGTKVTVTLPKAPAPEEFVPELHLLPNRPVVVLDDDESIHHVWQGRFESARVREHGIEVFHFSEPDQLRAWVKADPARAGSAVYLFDYELLGYKETGLSLAEEFGRGANTILVTSRCEEARIIEECRRLRIRMIPKGLSGFVPIAIGSGVKAAQAVLLDDDALTHMNWEYAAQVHGVELRAFTSPAEFLSAAGSFPKDIPLYIDSELGEGVKGEDIAVDLKVKGFTNICLATAHPPANFAHLPWLKVLTKEPPWH